MSPYPDYNELLELFPRKNRKNRGGFLSSSYELNECGTPLPVASALIFIGLDSWESNCCWPSKEATVPYFTAFD